MVKVLPRRITQRGTVIFGGLVAAGAIVGGIWLNPTTSTGGERLNAPKPALVTLELDMSGTGSTSATEKYDSFCYSIADVLGSGIGTGVIVRGVYHNVSNPNTASADIGFVGSCDDHTASGTDLFDNTCTGTGCRAYYTTGTLEWQGSGDRDYLKATIKKDPTSSFDAKVTLWFEDIRGE